MFFYRQRRKKPQSNDTRHSLFAKIATTGLHTGITFAAKKRKMKKTITFSKAGTSYIAEKLNEAVSIPLGMLFTAAGATADEENDLYSLNGIEDITPQQMLAIYTRKEAIDNLHLPHALEGCSIRTILPCPQAVGERLAGRPLNGERTFARSSIEVVKFGNGQNIDSSDQAHTMPTTLLAGTFCGCAALHTIYPMNLKNVNHIGSDTFEGCAALKEVRLCALGAAVRLCHSPQVSYQSLLYAVTNSSNGGFEITLHPATYRYLMTIERAPASVGGTESEWAALQTEGEKKNIAFNTTQFYILTAKEWLGVSGVAVHKGEITLEQKNAVIEGDTLFLFY